MSKVYVGLSGGVDSSVAAALLKEQGYEVVGVYMKNWSQNLPGFDCPWFEDYQDAKRVAVQLGIAFKVFDFEAEYKQKVVDVMIAQFETGITPNPDILCNQEIKFRLFYDTAKSDGADMIATGHYAKVVRSQKSKVKSRGPGQISCEAKLARSKDENKDQTYFLYRMPKDALNGTAFPLGDLTKPEVRQLAEKFGLVTAKKKESMGICFIGKVGIKEFLKNYIKTKPGKVFDQYGSIIGEHDGALFYTIGQRHGLDIGGGKPYYVTGKSISKNEVYVTSDLADKSLWTNQVTITSPYWINGSTSLPKDLSRLYVRLRHRAPLVSVIAIKKLKDNYQLMLEDDVRAVTPGQSAVLYDDQICLGGGIVTY